MHFPLSTRMRRSKREEHGTVYDKIKNSVSDPYHFDLDPDSRIRIRVHGSGSGS